MNFFSKSILFSICSKGTCKKKTYLHVGNKQEESDGNTELQDHTHLHACILLTLHASNTHTQLNSACVCLSAH